MCEVLIYDICERLSARPRNALGRALCRVDGRLGTVDDLYKVKGPPRGMGEKGVRELNRVLTEMGLQRVWESEEKRHETGTD